MATFNNCQSLGFSRHCRWGCRNTFDEKAQFGEGIFTIAANWVVDWYQFLK